MKQITRVVLPLLLASIIFGCQPKEIPTSFSEVTPSLSAVPEVYGNIEFPVHFTEANFTDFQDQDPNNPSVNQTKINSITDAGARLGRVLFYDKQLSINNTISCGSCHHQETGFADPVASSMGFKGARTPRNSMTIVNPILNNNFFWDSRVSTSEQLALEPVQNHIEMGMESLTKLEKKLAATSYYPALFREAFGTDYIQSQNIGHALAQFLNSMVSYNSKFDKGQLNDFADFTPMELMGKNLFFSSRAQCSSCHNGGNFDAPDAVFEEYGGGGGDPFGGFPGEDAKGTANIGLEVNYSDDGFEDGQFKIPSLRNIGLTAPYMHDGRFENLEDVVHHYSKGIQSHNNLDSKFRSLSGEVVRMNFTEVEVQSLVAFLHTLTDHEFITDPKFSDPFLY